jgi:hypothetical protein
MAEGHRTVENLRQFIGVIDSNGFVVEYPTGWFRMCYNLVPSNHQEIPAQIKEGLAFFAQIIDQLGPMSRIRPPMHKRQS